MAGKKPLQRTMGQIIRRRKSGKSHDIAVIETVAETAARRFKLRKDLSPEQTLEILRKKMVLGRARASFEKAKLAFLRSRKRRLISETCGIQGERLGIVLVQPELFGSYVLVRKFLRNLGCRLVFSKNILLSREQVAGLFGYQMGVYREFPFTAAILISGPSKILVFEHLKTADYLQRSEYLKYLREHDANRFQREIQKAQRMGPQGIFSEFFKGEQNRTQPGTIRGDVVSGRFAELGIGTGTKAGRLIDVWGVIGDKKAREGLPVLGGIHTPNEKEFLNEVTMLLSVQDLKQIKRRMMNKQTDRT